MGIAHNELERILKCSKGPAGSEILLTIAKFDSSHVLVFGTVVRG